MSARGDLPDAPQGRAPSPRWAVTVARTLGEAAGLRDEWLAMEGIRLTTHPDRVLALVEADDRLLRPHVVRLDRDAEPVAMAIAWLEDLRLASRLGPSTPYRPRLRSLTVASAGLIGAVDDREVAARLVGALRTSLSRGEAEVVSFRQVPLGSVVYAVIDDAAGPLTRDRASVVVNTWEKVLPDSLQAVMAELSSKTRLSLNNRSNRLRREFGDALEVSSYREPEHLEALLEEIELVAARTYQRAIGRSFRSDERQRRLTRSGLENGWVRAWVLKIEGRPVAFWYGEGWNRRFRAIYPGYDPEFARWGVGNYLTLRMFDDLCQEGETDVVDFGSGDSETKRHFAKPIPARNLHLFAPRLRPVRVNQTRTALRVVNNGVSAVLSHPRVRGRVVRLPRGWRPRTSV